MSKSSEEPVQGSVWKEISMPVCLGPPWESWSAREGPGGEVPLVPGQEGRTVMTLNDSTFPVP